MKGEKTDVLKAAGLDECWVVQRVETKAGKKGA